VQYKDGYVPSTIQDPQLSYVFGTGKAYGAEFFVNKTQGKFTGWVGYTLSWTCSNFPCSTMARSSLQNTTAGMMYL